MFTKVPEYHIQHKSMNKNKMMQITAQITAGVGVTTIYCVSNYIIQRKQCMQSCVIITNVEK